MSQEEFIGKLQMVYVGDRNAFNEIVGVYDELDAELKENGDSLVLWNELYNSLMKQTKGLQKENQRLNNDIKVLLKENEAKEKVIIKQDNVLNELERRIEKTKSEIDDLLIYDDFSDVTKGFGNIPEQLKFYLSECEHIEEFRLNELKESDK